MSRRTPFRGALLGLVARRPMSGYDLAKVFDSTLANVWSAKHSQIYPELAAMLEDGLVEMRAAGSRRRKEYAITDRGREELVRWLTEAPPTPGIVRNDALLRSFFLGYLPLGDAQEFLRRERDRHARQLDEYVADRESGRSDEPGGWTGGIPLEAGVRYERMMVEWADWALAELERLHEEGKPRARVAAGRSRSS
jgi:PadR family transcriptional regulator, regulatory protein AphA